MGIIAELREKVFNQDSGFLKRLDEWDSINAQFLGRAGQKDPQRVFLNALTEEIYEKMSNYKFMSPCEIVGMKKIVSTATRNDVATNKPIERFLRLPPLPSDILLHYPDLVFRYLARALLQP